LNYPTRLFSDNLRRIRVGQRWARETISPLAISSNTLHPQSKSPHFTYISIIVLPSYKSKANPPIKIICAWIWYQHKHSVPSKPTKGINITYQIIPSPASKGVKHCEYVVIFDSDFRLEPDYLRRAIPFLLHNPQIALVQGPISNLRRDLLDLLLCQTQDPPDPRRPASPLLLDPTHSLAFPGWPPTPNTKEEQGRGIWKRRMKNLASSNPRKINKKMKNNKRREKSTQLNKRGFLKLVWITVAEASLLQTWFWKFSAEFGEFVKETSSLQMFLRRKYNIFL